MTDMGSMSGGERNIKLLIAYDGTDFSGWQRQSGGNRTRTVQGCIEDVLAKLHKRPVPLTGSGRTDAGVHAAGQIANFYTGIRHMEAARFVPALNGLLPQDVRIMDAAETLPGFHARFDARSRTYRYHVICGRPALPTETRFALQLWRHPRLDTLNEYARLLRGELDCSFFASPKDPGASRYRYIHRAYFFVQNDTLIFEISANAFLWKMVRSIAGTLLHYEERNLPVSALRDLIARGERRLAGPTLPPQGLFLWKIDYYRPPAFKYSP